MPRQFERWSLRLRPQGRVLAQRERDCFNAVLIAAFAEDLGVVASELAQQFEDPIVHLPQKEGLARPLALSHPRRPPWLRGLGVRLPQCHEFVPRPLDNPLKISQKVHVHGIITRLKSLDRLLAAGDEDREQGYLLPVGPRLHRLTLPRYAAAKTPSALLCNEALRQARRLINPRSGAGTLAEGRRRAGDLHSG